MICPVSVYNKALEHRAELIDAAENKMKWHFSSFCPVCLSAMVPHDCFFRRHGVASRRKIGTFLLVQAAALDIKASPLYKSVAPGLCEGQMLRI